MKKLIKYLLIICLFVCLAVSTAAAAPSIKVTTLPEDEYGVDTTDTGEIHGLRFLTGTADSITIGWNRVTPDGVIKGYKLRWTVEGGATKTAVITGAGTNYNSSYKQIVYKITGLETGKTVTFEVAIWYNSDVTSDFASGSYKVLPEKPRDLTASSVEVSSTQVKLSWKAPASGTVNGYYIYRDGQKIAEVTSGVLSFIDIAATLKTGDTHTYSVRAFVRDSNGNITLSQASDSVKFTIRPGTPRNLTAKSQNTQTIKVNWAAVEGVTGYRIEWGLSSDDAFYNSQTLTGEQTLTYTIQGLAPLLGYKIRVQAYVEGGTIYNEDGTTTEAGTVYGSWAEPVTETTEPGIVPNVKAVFNQDTGNIEITWGKVLDTVTNYKVYRSTKSDTGFLQVFAGMGSNVFKWVDESVSVGETWYYKVIATYGAVESSQDDATVVWALAAPAAPQNLKIKNGDFDPAHGTGSAVLTWTKSDGADGYVIQRATNAAFTENLSKMIVVGGAKETATYTGLSMGITYYFRVCGYVVTENTGRGKYSNSVSLQGAPGDPDYASLKLDARNPQTIASGIKATWDAVDGAEGYWVAVSNVTTGTIVQKDVISGQSNTTYVFDGLTAGERYRVTVRSYRGTGFSVGTRKQDSIYWGSNIQNALPVLAPKTITVKANGSSSVILNWSKVYGVSGYWLKVTSADDTSFTTIDTNCNTALEYTLNGLKAGYTYKVEVYTYTNAQGTIFYSKDFGSTQPYLATATAMVAPKTPIGLKAVVEYVGGIPQVQLNWDMVTGLNAFNGGYFLLRNPGWGSTTTNEQVRRGEESNAFLDKLTADDIGKSLAYRVGTYLDPLHSNNEGNKLTGQESLSPNSGRVVVVIRNATPVVSASNDASGRIVLTWQSVPTADRYAVYRATTNDIGKSQLIEGIVTGTSYTDTGASTTPGTVYYYWVKAIKNSARTGDSLYSSSVKAAVALNTSGWGWNSVIAYAKSIDLSWKKLSGAQSYNVYRIANDGAPTKIANVKTTTYTDKNLQYKGKYEYSIRAVYGASESAYMPGAGRNGRWSSPRYTELTKIQNLKSTPQSMTEAKLTWDKVRDASGYHIVFTMEDNSTKSVDVTTNSYTLTNIPIGERIQAEVYPTVKEGGITYPVNKTEIDAVHGLVIIDNMVFAAPKATTKLEATSIGTRTVNVKWTAVEPKTTTRYAVLYRKKSESTYHNAIAPGALTQNTFCNILDLEPNTEYYIRVLSTYVDPKTNKQYDGGFKLIEVKTKPITIPGATGSLRHTGSSAAALRFAWNKVTSPSNTQYVTMYRKKGDTTWINAIAPGNVTSALDVRVSGLEPSTEYEFGVLSVVIDNGTQYNGGFKQITASTTAIPQPRNVIATAGTMTIDLQWDAPELAPTGTKYAIWIKTGDGGFTRIGGAASTAKNKSLTGLTSKTTYTVRVQSIYYKADSSVHWGGYQDITITTN